jgi:E3 ubiquitin-protein ligase HERC2
LQEAFTANGLSKFWNELVKDGEAANTSNGWHSVNAGNEKEDVVKNESNEKTKSNICEASNGTSCSCSGQKLHNTWEDEGKIHRDSDEIIDLWTWGEQPTISELTEAVNSLIAEQFELISEASKSTPSSIRLHQRLLVLERYYVAYISGSDALFALGSAHEDNKKNSDVIREKTSV